MGLVYKTASRPIAGLKSLYDLGQDEKMKMAKEFFPVIYSEREQ